MKPVDHHGVVLYHREPIPGEFAGASLKPVGAIPVHEIVVLPIPGESAGASLKQFEPVA